MGGERERERVRERKRGSERERGTKATRAKQATQRPSDGPSDRRSILLQSSTPHTDPSRASKTPKRAGRAFRRPAFDADMALPPPRMRCLGSETHFYIGFAAPHSTELDESLPVLSLPRDPSRIAPSLATSASSSPPRVLASHARIADPAHVGTRENLNSFTSALARSRQSPRDPSRGGPTPPSPSPARRSVSRRSRATKRCAPPHPQARRHPAFFFSLSPLSCARAQPSRRTCT